MPRASLRPVCPGRLPGPCRFKCWAWTLSPAGAQRRGPRLSEQVYIDEARPPEQVYIDLQTWQREYAVKTEWARNAIMMGERISADYEEYLGTADVVPLLPPPPAARAQARG